MNVTADLNSNHRLISKIHRNHRSLAALDTSNPDYKKASPVRRKLPVSVANKTAIIHSIPNTITTTTVTKPRLFYPSTVIKTTHFLFPFFLFLFFNSIKIQLMANFLVYRLTIEIAKLNV